ncbi:MAG: DEAD/DEAH box helicase, partial [Phycisphaerae bacterium]|nr:DEAD/DEAH box helicase [Phycisphaerae bacterium]
MFLQATGDALFPYQEAFADQLPALVNVPTGLGKTAMAVLGWLWRRRCAPESVQQQTPRRLVYCLPMRVLVEQTRDNAVKWLDKLRVLAGRAEFEEWDGNQKLSSYTPDHVDPEKIAIHVLMGGEEKDDWDIHPERDAIIIGTQDMLLSRALNRGYAASRARWPMHFGLLNTDCLWVFDEIQLMGSGLATTAQLEAFRRSLGAKDGNGCRSVWMSATMRPEWLSTVDFKDRIDSLPQLRLQKADHDDTEVKKRWNAKKRLERATAKMDGAGALADEIRDAHKPGTRTVVVVNTVKRACELYEEIKDHSSADSPARRKKAKAGKKGSAALDPTSAPPAALPKIILLHARFRPDDRKKAVEAALAPPAGAGTIVVSTQVIEAGVDVSATTLFTELAPWASLVQRFGRCNRRGDENEQAAVYWIDLPAEDAGAEKMRFPYELPDLRAAAKQLKTLTDVGLGSLEALNVELPFRHTHVIRRKDLIDLFDTTPDLAGNDIDIDRYVRGIDETDVRVFWRKWDGDAPPDDEPPPTREELCPAPIGDFKKFVVEKNVNGEVFRRDFLEGKWIALDATRIAPGQVYMIHSDAGGYDTQRGWDASALAHVEPLPRSDQRVTDPDDNDDDVLSRTSRWQTIAQHTDDVCRELDSILKLVAMSDRETAGLRAAARWHD